MAMPSYFCYVCPAEMQPPLWTAREKDTHNRIMHYKFKFQCEKCLTRFGADDREAYFFHYVRVHGVKPPADPFFPCLNCTKSFPSRSGITAGNVLTIL